MNKFWLTKIYTVENNIDGDFYIGSTTYYYLAERMNVHRQSIKDETSRRQSLLNRKMRELGVEQFKIRLLEEFPCETKEDKLLREQFWIDHLQPTLNQFKAIETRTPQQINRERYIGRKDEQSEYCKKYYAENAEAIKARVKAYAEANKDAIRERTKKYREAHAEEIKAQKKEVITCECGVEITKLHLSRHKRTKKHLDLINKS